MLHRASDDCQREISGRVRFEQGDAFNPGGTQRVNSAAYAGGVSGLYGLFPESGQVKLCSARSCVPSNRAAFSSTPKGSRGTLNWR